MNIKTEKKSNPRVEALKNFYYFGLFFAALGILFSSYSLFHHLKVKALGGETDAFCNINASVSCDKVANSIYSEISGIPLGVLGIGFFLSLFISYMTGVFGKKASSENMNAASVLVYLGAVLSVVLGIISITKVGSICIACIAIYLTCLALVANFLYAKRAIAAVYPFNLKSSVRGLINAAVVVASCIAIYYFAKPEHALPDKMLDLPGRQTDFSKKLKREEKVYDLSISRSEYAGFGEDFRKGSDQAKVTIVEFADYQCPGCATMATVFESINQEFGDKISFVFKNYPLDIKCNSTMKNAMHPFACDIAKMARCAGRYGNFWKFHHLAFEKQAEASLENTKLWGKSSGLRNEQIEECLKSPDILAKIQDDISVADRATIDGTPAIYVNGKKYVGGRDFQSLKQFIQSLL